MKPGSTSIARQSDTHAPHDVLALGHRLLGDQPRGDALDLLPVDRVHVDDQVLEHGHVAHRLDLDHAVARAGERCVEMGVAGERRFAVDANAAGTADRLAAGATDADRAVEAVFGLQDRLEHRAVRLELDRVLVPVGGLARLRVVAAQAQLELLRSRRVRRCGCCLRLSHQYFLSSGCHWVIVTGE
jgi:hypothetical protein